jgi:hypothetical protein
MELIDDLHYNEQDKVTEGIKYIKGEMGNWDPHFFETSNFEVACIRKNKREI